MAAERHVGTPDCLNGTCACGSAPKPEEEFDGTAWLRKHGSHTDPPCHECERIEQGRVKERREGIATEVLAAFVTHNSVSPQINWQLTAQGGLKAADGLNVGLEKWSGSSGGMSIARPVGPERGNDVSVSVG